MKQSKEVESDGNVLFFFSFIGTCFIIISSMAVNAGTALFPRAITLLGN